MFKVVTPKFSQTFDRWTDALNTAKELIPQCKNWTEDVRIFLCDELVWVYSREYKYPQYIGAGTYNRLARIFVQEALEEEGLTDPDNSAQPGE
ncbi:MAG: hypothetical protein WCA35_27300 [Kovacikia sp.]